MKIVDSILFNGEIDMLLLRLKQYDLFVDNFIIIEGDKSFTNIDKKTLYSNVIKEDIRFSEYLYKIEFYVHRINKNDPWENEIDSRNSIFLTTTFQNLQNDDIVIHGDCDEILRKITLNKIKNGHDIHLGKIFIFKNIFFTLNWHYPHDCYTTIIVKKENLLRENNIHELKLKFRSNKDCHYKDERGWHFSFFGNIDDIIRKINNFSHQEMNRPQYNNKEYILNEIINNGNAVDFFSVDWNRGNVPKLIKNNLNDLPHDVKLIDYFNLMKDYKLL